jgi:hypothetical protein
MRHAAHPARRCPPFIICCHNWHAHWLALAVYPRTRLSLKDAADILPVVHKVGGPLAPAYHPAVDRGADKYITSELAVCLQYDIRPLLAQVSDQLAQKLPGTWSMDDTSPSYILK